MNRCPKIEIPIPAPGRECGRRSLRTRFSQRTRGASRTDASNNAAPSEQDPDSVRRGAGTGDSAKATGRWMSSPSDPLQLFGSSARRDSARARAPSRRRVLPPFLGTGVEDHIDPLAVERGIDQQGGRAVAGGDRSSRASSSPRATTVISWRTKSRARCDWSVSTPSMPSAPRSPLERRRMDVADRPPPTSSAGMTTVWIRLASVMLCRRGRRGRAVASSREMTALGAGVDDEAVGPARRCSPAPSSAGSWSRPRSSGLGACPGICADGGARRAAPAARRHGEPTGTPQAEHHPASLSRTSSRPPGELGIARPEATAQAFRPPPSPARAAARPRRHGCRAWPPARRTPRPRRC